MTKPTDENPAPEIRAAVETIIGQVAQAAKPKSQVSATSQTTTRVYTRDLQLLNPNELKSVYALLAFVAHNENIRQETVQAIVEANFHVNQIEKLQHKDYEEVIRFLVDLRIDEMRN